MDKEEQNFLVQLLIAYRVEAQEHIASMLSGLLTLEKGAEADSTKKIIETIHREAHSLKGASRAVTLGNIESICANIEEVFTAWKLGRKVFSIDQFDTLHYAIDMISVIMESDPLIGTSYLEEVEQINTKLRNVLSGDECKGEQQKSLPMNKSNKSLIESVRIPVSRLTELLLQAEEMLSVKSMVSKHLAELRDLEYLLVQSKEELNDITHEFESNHLLKQKNPYFLFKAQFNKVLEQLHIMNKDGKKVNHYIEVVTDDLLDNSKRLLMFPFSILSDIFPKIIRDLARDQDKEVNFVIKGEQTHVDKKILEEMKEVLIHIVRNAIDHGIESLQDRITNGKPPKGEISLAVVQKSGNEIEIIIHDDGGGVKINDLKKSAIQRGIITHEEAAYLSLEQTLPLVFCSGISTKKEKTDISGQGLGMTIVKEKVENLNGQVMITSQEQQGTTIQIKLPITLATFKGVLCQVSDESFVIPTIHVERVLRFRRDDIKRVGNQATIKVSERILPLISLETILNIESARVNSNTKGSYAYIIVVSSLKNSIALEVDAVVNEMDILVKNVAATSIKKKIITGVTVISAGKVVPILNISELDTMLHHVEMTDNIDRHNNDMVAETLKSILLVDDSITTRMLLKNILEMAGFIVSTAVDGVDAWNKIKLNKFSLIVTDLEMPNMDGFTLIEHIKKDQKLAQLPTVIITTRDSQQDRIRGIDVGADAYIVKKGLNDTELINVIKELI